MTLDDFKRTVSAAAPPENISPALRALWHDARGDWESAHGVAQAIDDESGAWVHAYLHRKEGDATNAAYLVTAARGSQLLRMRFQTSGSTSSQLCWHDDCDRNCPRL